MSKNKSKAQANRKKKTPPPAPPVSGAGLRRRMIVVLALSIVLISGAVAFWTYTDTQSQQKNATMTSMAYVVGSAQNCAGSAPFAAAVGLERGVLDTRANFVKGLALREVDANGNILRSYQHPSWTQAGYLGSFQRDAAGNIYVIPTPYINILDNPIKKANIVYRIDRNTGDMTPLANLPILAPATPDNAYGLLGLTYDCGTRSLYTSSVFGSTPTNAAGCIFQIDPNTGEVRSSLEYIDAFGLGVFNSVHGKRLYFGLARTPDIYSVALDANGGFTQDIQPELSLAEAGMAADTRAKVLLFQGANQLVIRTIPFDFNLAIASQDKQIILTYGYDTQADKWQLMASQTLTGTSLNS